MSQRSLTTKTKDGSTGNPTSVFVENPVAYDWHQGESSQTKMMTSIDDLRRAGTASPTEAQIKARYVLRGGKITS